MSTDRSSFASLRAACGRVITAMVAAAAIVGTSTAQQPCTLPPVGFGDPVHSRDGAAGRFPIVTNPTDVMAFGQGQGIDPCAGRSYVRKPGNGHPFYEWVTERSNASGPAPFESQCYNWLLSEISSSSGGDTPSQMTWHPGQLGCGAYIMADPPSGDDGWRTRYDAGFGFNADLSTPLSLGDFLSPAPTLAESSVCLVLPHQGGAPTGWQGLTRPTLDQHVDLITGSPLVRVTDLELPFDGASFRLTRTRSQLRADSTSGWAEAAMSISKAYQARNLWWDWTGMGWMAGENPLLLIDSALPNVVGDQPVTTRLVLDAHHSIPFQRIESSGRYEAPPRFRATLRHNGLGWSAAGRAWSTPPTQYDISLYDGAITYTFVAVREDVPRKHWYPPYVVDGQFAPEGAGPPAAAQERSMHDRPLLPNQFSSIADESDHRRHHNPWDGETNPGFGLPYYGLCVEIRDRAGHRVEIQYADSARRNMDDPATSNCIECRQDGIGKGQIKWIKLWSGGNVKWTLLYAHRRFFGNNWMLVPGNSSGTPVNTSTYQGTDPLSGRYNMMWQPGACPQDDPDRYELHGMNAIDRIYVFEGNNSSCSETSVALNTHYTDACGWDESFTDSYATNPHDPLLRHNATAGGTPWPTNWKYQVRYHYDYCHEHKTDVLSQFIGTTDGHPRTPAVLAMTSMVSRDPNVAGSARSKHRVYKYLTPNGGPWRGENEGDIPIHVTTPGPWLQAVYEEEDLVRLSAAASSRQPDDAQILKLTGAALRQALAVNATNEVDSIDTDPALPFASIRLENWGVAKKWAIDAQSPASVDVMPARDVPTIGALQGNPVSGGQPYLTVTANASTMLSDNVAQAVKRGSWRDEQGRPRFYSTIRLLISPQAYGGEEVGLLASQWPTALNMGPRPMASMWFIPYAWQGYWDAWGSGLAMPADAAALSQLPELTTPRFVDIIDEFESWEKMTSDAPTAVYDASAFKPGMKSRRVLTLNASGVILKDYRWEYGPDGAVMSGGGLGEEYIYSTIYNYFKDHTNVIGTGPIATCPPVDPSTGHPVSGGYSTNAPPDGGCNADPSVPPLPTPAMVNELLLVEKRSVGWSALPREGSINKSNAGLIEFIEYGLLPETGALNWRDRVQLVAEGIQRGASTSAPFLYTRQVFHDSADPSKVIGEVKFLAPQDARLSELPGLGANGLPAPLSASSALPQQYSVTYFKTIESTDTPPEGERRRVVGRIVAHPPKQQRPNGNWYFPVERESYGENGATEFSVSGLVTNVGNPLADLGDPSASLLFTHYTRDTAGRAEATLVDVVPGSGSKDIPINEYGMQHVQIPAFPDLQWVRLGGGSALNYATVFRYDDFGVSDMFYFTHAGGSGQEQGRRWARRYVVHNVGNDDHQFYVRVREGDDSTSKTSDTDEEYDDTITEEFIFNNVRFVGLNTAGKPTFRTDSQGERRVYMGTKPQGSPTVATKGWYPNSESAPIDFTLESYEYDATTPQHRKAPKFVPLARVNMGLDASGRPQSAELIEFDQNGAAAAVGSKLITELVDVRREEEIDGSLTRITRDFYGHHMRTYTGYGDFGWTNDHRNPDPGTPGPGEHGYDMVLTERFEYGTGASDAWLPTIHRKYRSNEAWADQYYVAPASSADHEQYATRTSYDWRMRPVRTEVFGKGDPLNPATPVMTTSLVYLDHADRTRLMVTFGVGGPPSDLGGLDPVGRGWTDSVPSAAEFMGFDALHRPIAIAETIYGPDGDATETRQYDMAWNGQGAPRYQSTFRYSGKSGETLSQRPGAPSTVNAYDALGRLIRASTVSPIAMGSAGPFEFELACTQYVYDADGNVSQEVRRERMTLDAPGAAATLDDTNSVRSRTVHWYDSEKRKVASAALGSEMSVDGRSALIAGVAPNPFNYAGATQPDAAVVSGAPVTYQGSAQELLNRGAALTIFKYDPETGLLRHVVHPNGAVTTSEYGRANRLARTIENSTAVDPRDVRRTAHDYQYGRLTKLIAQLANDGGYAPQLEQVNEVKYGADVLDESFVKRSYAPSLVGSLHLPNPAGGESSADASITLRYDFHGHVIERTDGRGVTLRYGYDALDRMVWMEVGSGSAQAFVAGYPASMTVSGVAPVERVGYVEYEYDRAGQLASVIARQARNGAIIARNEMSYDARGNLLEEKQIQGAIAGANPPKMNYEWEYVPTSAGNTGRTRLASMTYPARPDGSRRVITIEYGSAGSIFDLASMVTGMSTPGTGGTLPLAAFDWAGSGRRVGLRLGADAVAQSARQLNGFAKLDGFGRVLDLHYQSSSNAQAAATLFRARYTYDLEGNRISARVTQVDEPGHAGDNTRSQLNSYNALGQLTGTQVGTLGEDANGHLLIDPLGPHRIDQWSLDPLGNWNGGYRTVNGVPAAGRTITYADSSLSTTTRTTDAVDARNRISTRTFDGGAGAIATPLSYDAAGNLICDGVYYYQYDAWNRVVQINAKAANPATGPPTFLPDPARLVKHFTYDGQGRLIRAQSPYPDAATWSGTTSASGKVRSERFFYDGVRRVQELYVDPVLSIDAGLDSGDSEIEQSAQQAMNQSPAPPNTGQSTGDLENTQSGLGGEEDPPGGGVGGGGGPALTGVFAYVEREHVWGPGDRGPDELLVEFDAQKNPWYVIQDEGGDVVALCDSGGSAQVPGNGTGGENGGGASLITLTGLGRVCAQWTYDAYGAVQSAADLRPHPVMRAGHKGLFCERLDGAVGLTGELKPRLVPSATNLYHVRNRAYMPSLGRWLQEDPHAAGGVLLEDHARGNHAARVVALDMLARCGDGLSTYQYLGSNGWRHSDPMGLFIGLYALEAGSRIGNMADDLISTYAANLEMDLDWALDWSMPDDAHSRVEASWVGEILAHHTEEALNDALMEILGPVGDAYSIGTALSEMVMAGSLRGGRLAAAPLRIAGKVYRGARGHLHHLFPKYLYKSVGRYLASALSASSNLLIRIPKRFHKAYHNVVDEALHKMGGPKGMRAGTREFTIWIGQAKDPAKRAMQVLRKVKQVTQMFEKDNNLTGMTEGFVEAMRGLLGE